MNFVRYAIYLISIITAYYFYGFPLAVIFTVTFTAIEFLIYITAELFIQQAGLLSELTKISQSFEAIEPFSAMQVIEAQHNFAATEITPQEEALYERVKQGDENAANEFLAQRSLGEATEIKGLPMPLKTMVIDQIYSNCSKSADEPKIVWDDTIETDEDK